MNKITAPIVAFLLVFGAAACGNQVQQPLTCGPGLVLEVDDDGQECEPDTNGNGIDDENEGIDAEEPEDEAAAEEEDSDGNKRTCRRPKKRC